MFLNEQYFQIGILLLRKLFILQHILYFIFLSTLTIYDRHFSFLWYKKEIYYILNFNLI